MKQPRIFSLGYSRNGRQQERKGPEPAGIKRTVEHIKNGLRRRAVVDGKWAQIMVMIERIDE
jgi:hypothetical protein